MTYFYNGEKNNPKYFLFIFRDKVKANKKCYSSTEVACYSTDVIVV